MSEEISINQLRRRFQELTGQIVMLAVIGDSTGDTRASRDGYVTVRLPASNGEFTRPAEARAPLRGAVLLQPGTYVNLKRDHEGELMIDSAAFAGQLSQSRDPALNNPGDMRAYKWVQQARILTGMCHAIATPESASLSVGVRTWPYIRHGQWRKATGTVDLTSLLPSAGNHRLALVYVDMDNALLAVGSTEKADTIPMDSASLTDMQSAYEAATSLAAPIWFWYLTNGLTTLDGRPYEQGGTGGNSYLDARQFIGIDLSSCTLLKTQPSTIAGTHTINSGCNVTLSGSITVTGTLTVEGTLRVI